MTKEQLISQARAGRLPQCMTIVLWRACGRDVTYHNADMNQLVLEAKTDEQLEFLISALAEKK